MNVTLTLTVDVGLAQRILEIVGAPTAPAPAVEAGVILATQAPADPIPEPAPVSFPDAVAPQDTPPDLPRAAAEAAQASAAPIPEPEAKPAPPVDVPAPPVDETPAPVDEPAPAVAEQADPVDAAPPLDLGAAPVETAAATTFPVGAEGLTPPAEPAAASAAALSVPPAVGPLDVVDAGDDDEDPAPAAPRKPAAPPPAGVIRARKPEDLPPAAKAKAAEYLRNAPTRRPEPPRPAPQPVAPPKPKPAPQTGADAPDGRGWTTRQEYLLATGLFGGKTLDAIAAELGKDRDDVKGRWDELRSRFPGLTPLRQQSEIVRRLRARLMQTDTAA